MGMVISSAISYFRHLKESEVGGLGVERGQRDLSDGHLVWTKLWKFSKIRQLQPISLLPSLLLYSDPPGHQGSSEYISQTLSSVVE